MQHTLTIRQFMFGEKWSRRISIARFMPLCNSNCIVFAKWLIVVRMQQNQVLWLEGPQWTKIFQYCTCPAGRVTYNFHSSCKHTHLSFKSVCNKEHIREYYVLPRVILSKALVLQDECFGRNYSYFLDFTHNYEWTSEVFVPRPISSSFVCFQFSLEEKK